MAGFKLTSFAGLLPRVPSAMLPEGAATVAQNCDLAYGDLRNTNGGFLYSTMSNTPKSIYTDDGLSFYTWSIDVNAVRSPLVNDQFTRMYYTGDTGGMRVASRLGTRVNGGAPASSYIVGVPKPTVPPSLVAQGIPDVNSTNANLTFTFHYEYGGVKYQEIMVGPTALGANRYQFTPPSKGTTTPTQAFAVLRLVAKDKTDSTQLFDLYTSNSSFKSTSGLYSLSMAKDQTGATYTAVITAALSEADKETRAYVYTFVNTYGEEGPPSAPVEITTGITLGVTVTVNKDGISGYAPIKEIRVYRTPTGSSIASYFYVGSLQVLSSPTGAIAFSDTVDAALLNEEISSIYYYPPDTALVGLMALPNGILCAWKGNELHFSEAYKPWAWPPAYVKTLPYTIVGGIKHGSGAFITTVANPYIISGVSPDTMTPTLINVAQAGVSKWAIEVVDEAVLYASNDGIVTVSGGSASLNESQVFFTREVWRSRVSGGLSSMRFAVWDGRLVVYSGSAAFTPFMLRTDEARGSMTDLPGLSAQCSFTSPLSDQLYYTSGNSIYQFNGGTAQTAVWQSREAVIPRPCNFGVAQTLVEGNWTLQLYAYIAGTFTLKHTEALTTGQKTFRLPSGYESDRYMVKLTGSGRFRELRVAQSPRELAGL